MGYFEKEGYYTKDDGAPREVSAWAGKGAAELGLSGQVDPERFRAVPEGQVPGGRPSSIWRSISLSQMAYALKAAMKGKAGAL